MENATEGQDATAPQGTDRAAAGQDGMENEMRNEAERPGGVNLNAVRAHAVELLQRTSGHGDSPYPMLDLIPRLIDRVQAGEHDRAYWKDRYEDLDRAHKQTLRERRRVQRLHLERDDDVSGVSGTGVVAYGAMFPDGTITMRWDTKVRSTVMYDSLEDLIAIAGHGGKTRVVFDD